MGNSQSIHYSSAHYLYSVYLTPRQINNMIWLLQNQGQHLKWEQMHLWNLKVRPWLYCHNAVKVGWATKRDICVSLLLINGFCLKLGLVCNLTSFILPLLQGEDVPYITEKIKEKIQGEEIMYDKEVIFSFLLYTNKIPISANKYVNIKDFIQEEKDDARLVRHDRISDKWRPYYNKVKKELTQELPDDIINLVFSQHIFTGNYILDRQTNA